MGEGRVAGERESVGGSVEADAPPVLHSVAFCMSWAGPMEGRMAGWPHRKLGLGPGPEGGGPVGAWPGCAVRQGVGEGVEDGA